MSSSDVGASTVRRVASLGMLASAGLAALNIVVGLQTGSKAVFATGVEFAGDVLASGIVLFGTIVAARPADANHPYGHGRLETLAAFVVGLILVAGGLGICWNALQAVDARHPPPGVTAVLALLVAIVIRSAMSVVKFRVGRRSGSAALTADAWNDTVDIVGAAVALVAVGLTRYDSTRFLAADHYGGFAVGILVMLTAVRVVRDATMDLIDTMPDEDLIRRVRATAKGVAGVRGLDKVRARKTGLQYHVDLHVEVDPDMTVAEAHAVAGHVRSRVRADVDPVADVLVHIEPAPPDRSSP